MSFFPEILDHVLPGIFGPMKKFAFKLPFLEGLEFGDQAKDQKKCIRSP
jgi:hypothetical protein